MQPCRLTARGDGADGTRLLQAAAGLVPATADSRVILIVLRGDAVTRLSEIGSSSSLAPWAANARPATCLTPTWYRRPPRRRRHLARMLRGARTRRAEVERELWKHVFR